MMRMEVPGLGSRNLARDDEVGGGGWAETVSPRPKRERRAGVCCPIAAAWRYLRAQIGDTDAFACREPRADGVLVGWRASV